MLHTVSPNIPPSRGSISFPTQNLEECQLIRDNVRKTWDSNSYRVSANCIYIK